jgi:hypothetical protein
MRSALCCLALVLTSACAAGEPLDGGSQALELGEEPPVTGLVYVDIANDEGQPLVAELVWISTDERGPQRAQCFDTDLGTRCPTWVSEFKATEEVVATAELCGETFSDTVSVAAMQDAGSVDFGLAAAHVTITADLTGCGSATPTPDPADAPQR